MKNKENWNIANEIIRYQKNKDKDLRDKIFINNMGMVDNIAKLYSTSFNIDYLELREYGYLGLLESIENFTITNSTNIRSYMIIYISGYILNAIPKIYGIKRQTFYHDLHLLKIQIEQLTNGSKEEITDYILNDFIEMKSEKKQLTKEMLINLKIKIALNFPISLDEYLNKDNHINLTKELITEKDPTYTEVEKIKIKEDINECLKKLPPRQEEIIKMYYNINHSEQMSLKNIGSLYNITPQRTYQLLQKAHQNLSKMEKIKKYK